MTCDNAAVSPSFRPNRCDARCAMLRDGPCPTRTLQRPLHPWHRHVLRKGALVSSAGFVHLHTHSEYSDFDGLSSVERLVQAADRKSTRLNSSHVAISYAVFCLKKKISTIGSNSLYM